MPSTFHVCEILYPEPHPKKRFKIIETFHSIDGPRMRLCDMAFDDRGRAQAFVDLAHKPAGT